MRCYRCRKPGHLAKDCALPERVCACCQQTDHMKEFCSEHAMGIPMSFMLSVLSYLSLSDLLRVRLVCKSFDFLAGKLPQAQQHCLDRRASKVLLERVLPNEPLFKEFKTATGVKFLVSRLTRETVRTPIGKAKVWDLMRTKVYNQRPLTKAQYLQHFPTVTDADYEYYRDVVFPMNAEAAKYDTKMEVKALKATFYFLSVKYATIRNKDFHELADKNKYDVVLKDRPFVRRVDNQVNFSVQKRTHKKLNCLTTPTESPIF